MKLVKYILIALVPLLMFGCATVTPEQNQQQQDDLNMYMVSHGHSIPNHQ